MTTGAELKSELGNLGLPPSWFAAECDVTMRSVVRWFDADHIPAYVDAKLQLLLDRARTTVNELISRWDSQRRPVVLRTYRTDSDLDEEDEEYPATWHRQITLRAAHTLRSLGHEVTTEYR